MRKITAVRVLNGYRLQLTFDDGVTGTVDVSDLAGKGVFAVWRDRRAFESVRIGSSGELVWGDQVDLCPDALYLKATGKRPEDVCPVFGTSHPMPEISRFLGIIIKMFFDDHNPPHFHAHGTLTCDGVRACRKFFIVPGTMN